MIEITLIDGARAIARATAETAEDALLAARTLWDDLSGMRYHFKPYMTLHVDDRLIATLDRRP